MHDLMEKISAMWGISECRGHKQAHTHQCSAELQCNKNFLYMLFYVNPYFGEFLHSFFKGFTCGQSTLLGNLWICPGRLALVLSVLSSVFQLCS